MSAITTHILDTSRGQPAAGVPVRLDRRSSGGEWTPLGQGVTNSDGRLSTLLPDDAALTIGTYRLTFDTRVYSPDGFYLDITVIFEVRDAGRHYHVPLLLSPYGYTTYRGS